MATKSAFIRNVFIASVVTAVLASYPVIVYLSQTQLYSVIAGYFISLINALIGYRMNEAAFNKSVKGFMVLVFGGMGLRILVVGILLLIVIYYTHLDSISLVASVFFYYVLFVAIEILYLHKKQLQGKLTAGTSVQTGH
jgi:hypothetical protein